MMFHGLFGNAEALGYLLIFHVVALAHEEDLPAFVGQAVDGSPELGLVERTVGGLLVADVPFKVGGREVGNERILLAQAVQTGVTHHGVKIGFRVVELLSGLRVFQQTDKTVAHDVFSRVDVLQIVDGIEAQGTVKTFEKQIDVEHRLRIERKRGQARKACPQMLFG